MGQGGDWADVNHPPEHLMPVAARHLPWCRQPGAVRNLYTHVVPGNRSTCSEDTVIPQRRLGWAGETRTHVVIVVMLGIVAQVLAVQSI